MEQALTHADCLSGPEGCKGEVAYRMALSTYGSSFPRCDHHWEVRLREEDRLNRDYPDSPVAPAWFDPADAGETWDEEGGW